MRPLTVQVSNLTLKVPTGEAKQLNKPPKPKKHLKNDLESARLKEQNLNKSNDLSTEGERGKKTILRDITCTFPGGELTAVMGPSGAGKTSLLKLVSGDRVIPLASKDAKHNNNNGGGGLVSGTVIVDNVLVSTGEQMKALSGMVFQDDILCPSMTVREAIQFAAILKSPPSPGFSSRASNKPTKQAAAETDLSLLRQPSQESIFSAASCKPDSLDAKVQAIIDVLGLTGVADNLIGKACAFSDAGYDGQQKRFLPFSSSASPRRKTSSGVSGGERKRVSIAMQLVTDPPILFLDEPTSGLDALTATIIVGYLKKLSSVHGKTIVATIHQPSSQLFHMFDRLVLLGKGGVCVYEGQVKGVVEHFGKLGYQCPPYANPADFLFFDVLNDAGRVEEIIQKTTMTTENSARFHSLKARHLEGGELAELAERPSQEDLRYIPPARSFRGSIHAFLPKTAPFATQFRLLYGRAFKALIRDKLIIPMRVVRALFFGVLIGSVYRRDSASAIRPAQGLIQDRVSSLYFLLTNELFGGVAIVISIFEAERPVFLREYRLGYYGVAAYFWSKVLVEAPLQIVFPVVTVSIPYWLIGYRGEWDAWLKAMGIFILISHISAALGIFLGACFEKIDTALTAMPMLLLPLMIFGGILVNLKNVPWPFLPIKWISPVKHAFVALTKNDLTGYIFPNCTPAHACTGNTALESFGINEEPSIAAEVLIMFVTCLVLYAAGYLALWRIARTSKS